MSIQTKKKLGRRKTKALPAIPAMKRISELKFVPDLTAAITAATLLEGSLERALANRMIRMSAKEHNAIFHSGPLRNFQPKIDLGRALNLFGHDTEADFRNVAKIRNEFAHSFNRISFETPRIKQSCSELMRPEMRAVDLFSGSWGKNDSVVDDGFVRVNPKYRYLKTISMLVFLLESSSIQRPKRDKAPWPRFNS